eukprot:787235-Prorocentrum_minimum.AAC.1
MKSDNCQRSWDTVWEYSNRILTIKVFILGSNPATSRRYGLHISHVSQRVTMVGEIGRYQVARVVGDARALTSQI